MEILGKKKQYENGLLSQDILTDILKGLSKRIIVEEIFEDIELVGLE